MIWSQTVKKMTAGIGVAALLAVMVPIGTASAADLTTVSGSTTPETPATATTTTVSFNPVTSLSAGDKIRVIIPDEFIIVSAPLLTTDVQYLVDSITTAPTSLTINGKIFDIEIPGAVTSANAIDIEISNLQTATEFGQYSFAIITMDSTDVVQDTGLALVNVTNNVIVRASVFEMLKMELSGGDLNGNVLDFGNLVLGTAATQTHNLMVDTNNTSGFTVTMQGSGLDNGSVNFSNPVGSSYTSMSTWTPGTLSTGEGFGFRVDGTGTNAVNMVTNGFGGTNGFAAGQYVGTSSTGVYQVIDSAQAVNSADDSFTVEYVVRADASTQAGLYEDTITYVVSGK